MPSSSSRYKDKLILAPMVRVGTLPMRLIALRFGADLVYTEELIDWKILRSQRVVNDVLGTVDYVDTTDGTIVFRTCQEEKDRVIIQIGTGDPDRAVRAAKYVEKDVSGIDINMGCPKEFSIKGGMGAALLSQPEKAWEILNGLVTSCQKPITCKIRVLDDESETIALCKKLESSGISAIAVHGRTRTERPQHANRNSTIHRIAQALDIPVIANGGSREMDTYEDIIKFKKDTGASSVMVARAAEWNVSIFRREGKLPLDDLIETYLKCAVDYDNAPANSKYCVQNMLRELQETPKGKQFLEAQTLFQMCDLWGLGSYCRKKEMEYSSMGFCGRRDVQPLSVKKMKIDNDGVMELRCAFIRSLYARDEELPKTRLMTYIRRNSLDKPLYETTQLDKLFQSTVTVNKKKYRSSYWEKSKRWAEQGAAIVCLCDLGEFDIESLRSNGILS